MIDEDRGISGTSVENRPGFQRLLAEIALGHVLIVFGREMSRLARSCADWHRLLERSARFQVLLGDADGVYDPADFDDRLLLGLKGTMSEAELHILRGPGKGRLVWRRPRRSTLYEMLRHPICTEPTPSDGARSIRPDARRANRSPAVGMFPARIGSACSRTRCRPTSRGSSSSRTVAVLRQTIAGRGRRKPRAALRRS